MGRYKIRDGLAKLPPLLDTKISGRSDKTGELLVRGYSLLELGAVVSFEEMSYLLLYKKLPSSAQLQEFSETLNKKNSLPSIMESVCAIFTGKEHPLDMITSCLSAYASTQENPVKKNATYLIDQVISAMSYYALLLSIHVRKRLGLAAMFFTQHSDHSFSENFIERCFGGKELKNKAYYLDLLLRFSSEHGLTCSTLAARNSASARCSVISSVIAAIQAWHGFRHGTASEYAYKDLLAIHEKGGDVEAYYLKQIKAGISPCGFGHRVFKTEKDPRTSAIEFYLKKLSNTLGSHPLYPIAQNAVEFFEKRRNMYANPDLYIGIVLAILGFQPQEMSAIVFMGRLAGISAHILEENSPMRPLWRGKAQYTGMEKSLVVPIDKR